ncbi:hypothetical protein ACFSQJ_08075 [Croceitalea marina]|uniref:Cardiolipin synthase N-terminal domain-containing protein n=1 Tax=Croceitalea marina TaxID=1775166 RepID=A0ABW5MXK9_9FLAO
MIKFILIIIVGAFFVWIAKKNRKNANENAQVSNAKYWIWFVVGLLYIGVGFYYLVGALIETTK